MRIQTIPNFVWSENRLCLTRLRWEDGVVGKGGVSKKLSISIIWEPRDLWVGIYWNHSKFETTVYICLIPCLPVRFKLIRAWGGIIP